MVLARRWSAAALLLLALAGCSGHGSKVAVPRTEFTDLPAALGKLQRAGLRASVPYFPPLPSSAGGPNANDLSIYRVASQSPAAGATARRGSAVSLALSVVRPLGIASIAEPIHRASSVTVPNLVGRTYEQALATEDPWPGYWVEVGQVAPLAAADGVGSFRVVAQSPAPGTRLPYGGIKRGVNGVRPSLSTVTVTLGPGGQTAAAARTAINRADAHAESLLRIGGEFQAARLGGLFPGTPAESWCRIQRGTSVTRGLPGNCWTAVDATPFGGTVVYRELWDGHRFHVDGAPPKPGLEHTWRLTIDGTGAIRAVDESGDTEPQKGADAGTLPPGQMEGAWLRSIADVPVPRRARGPAAAELEARVRASVEASGATPESVRALAVPGRGSAVAVTLRTDDPPIYLRDRVRPVFRALANGGRPAYLLVRGPTGQRAMEWYGTGNGDELFVPRRLRGCSPIEAVGWADIPPCPE